ncbi:MAG: hypothetical protein U5N58_14190 [Actinomycetota bacterium]|nr:hypothetical protein [Actinomycetota bacterium]
MIECSKLVGNGGLAATITDMILNSKNKVGARINMEALGGESRHQILVV